VVARPGGRGMLLSVSGGIAMNGSHPSRPKRRWYQFSLPKVLVLIIPFAITDVHLYFYSLTHLRHLEILTYRCETSYAHAIWAWHQARSLVAG
jgi:hypothetical protein